MKIIILLFFFIMSFISHAQNVNIPDANFKNALANATPATQTAKDINGNWVIIDLNGDNEIQESEALNIYELYVTNKSIADITGILSFQNLTTLYCSVNSITELDVSSLNNTLTFLQCSYNLLEQYDPSSNTNLTTLAIAGNQLTSIDVSANVNLTYLSVQSNLLTSVDASNNINLTRFHCSNNSELEYLNLRNGNNINFSISQPFSYYDNLPKLERVCVDNLNSDLANFITAEVGHPICFVTDCNETSCNTASIDEYNKLRFSIYPNPTKDIIKIKSENQIEKILVYNLSGKLLLKNSSKKEININSLAQGIYFLKAIDVNKVFGIQKLIKE